MEHQESYLPGWPTRIGLMQTSAGTQISEFRLGPAIIEIPISPTYASRIPAETNFNQFTGINETGVHVGDLRIYYSRGLYPVLQKATKRVIDCIQGKINFAQSENSL